VDSCLELDGLVTAGRSVDSFLELFQLLIAGRSVDSCLKLDALVTAGRSVDSFLELFQLVTAGRSVADAVECWTAALMDCWTVGTLTQDLGAQEVLDLFPHGDQTCSLFPPWCTHLFSNMDR